MMAKSRWTQKPAWYCCHWHDPNFYQKGSQRMKESQEWRRQAVDEMEGEQWEH